MSWCDRKGVPVQLSSDGTYVPMKVKVLSGFKKRYKVLSVYWDKGTLCVDIQERK